LNEEGTEAAAATDVIIPNFRPNMPPPPAPKFFADNPFIFMLVKENEFLFCGIFKG